MDALIIVIAIVATFIILRVVKSIIKFIVAFGIIAVVIYFLDIKGMIDIGPFLDGLGI